MVRLSICIPTYNFGAFIGETLDSILSQLTPEVEVVVFDGGSQDNTQEEVAKRQHDTSQLCYVRQDFRGGIDRDIDRAVQLARGEYCWLFSADDVMLPKAVEFVLESIKTGCDVYLFEHMLCDIRLNPIKPWPALCSVEREFDFSDPAQREVYFRVARTSEAFFSFMGTPVFRLDRWSAVQPPASFYGTCWIVAGRLLWGMGSGIKLSYIPGALMLKRGENDSFLDKGLVNRLRIAVEEFQHVSDTIFERSSFEARQIRRVLQTDISFSILLKAKIATVDRPGLEDIVVLNQVVSLLYCDSGLDNWARRWFFHLLPVPFLRVVKAIFAVFKKQCKKYGRA